LGNFAEFFASVEEPSYKMDDDVKKIIIYFAIVDSTAWKREDKVRVIKKLLELGGDPALVVLNRETSYENLTVLVEAGANVNLNYQGFTALHGVIVSVFERKKKLQYLIEKGADVNACVLTPASPIGTPLHVVLANENIKVAIHYIDLIKDKFDSNLKDGEGKTVLLLAAKIRSSLAVKKLLEAFKDKIDVNAVDAKNRTALHFACAYGDVEMVQALLAAGADINAKDASGNTPLHYANAKVGTVRALLESIEIRPDRDEKALRNGIVDSIKVPLAINDEEILATKKNFAKYRKNFTKIINQCETSWKRENDFKYLAEQERNLTGKELIDVCMQGHTAVVDILLKAKVDVNLKNNNDRCAVEMATDPACKALLQASNAGFWRRPTCKQILTAGVAAAAIATTVISVSLRNG